MARVKGFTEGVAACIETTLTAAAYKETQGDLMIAKELRALAAAFELRIDAEVTSVDIMGQDVISTEPVTP